MEKKYDENRVWTESKLKENQDWVASSFQYVKKENQEWYTKQEEQRMIVVQKIKSEVL